jgi:hypothetical protein
MWSALFAMLALSAMPVLTALAADTPSDLPLHIQELRVWAVATRDNAGQPFVVLDKRGAHLWLFDGRGQVLGNTPVLLGMAKGDDSVPGIGERPIQQILPHERTTPAGRFLAEAGENADGEDIFWVDYDAAVSMHRVRAKVPGERRLQRLASPTPADNRISYGCINVPVAFYDLRLKPTLLRNRGVVYVLPETTRSRPLWQTLQAAAELGR